MTLRADVVVAAGVGRGTVMSSDSLSIILEEDVLALICVVVEGIVTQ